MQRAAATSTSTQQCAPPAEPGSPSNAATHSPTKPASPARGDWLLRRTEDWRTLAFVSLYFLDTYVLWFHAAALPAPVRAALWIGLCHFSFVGAVATHNTMHAPVFHARVLNKLFQCVLTLTYGHPVSCYVPGHNLSHHKYTQTPRDIMRTTKVRFRWHLLNGLLFQPLVAPDVLRSDFRYLLVQRHLKRPVYAQACLELGVLAAASLAQLWASPARFLLLVYVPHFFGQWGIVTMNMLQHDGCEVAEENGRVSKGPANLEMNAARNFIGPLLNYLCLNNGYHTIHHMFPHMHWGDLPAAHAKHVAPVIHPALCHGNMARYIWTTFVYPGRREWYTGKPLDIALHPARDEVDWIMYPKDDPYRPPNLRLYNRGG